MLRWCLDRGYDLRFIEQMPLDAQHAWDREKMVTADEIRARLSERLHPHPDARDDRGSAPAELFLVDGGPATVGIIASVSAPFCAACDRVRLTADGQVRNCLFAKGEVDLRGPAARRRHRRRPRRADPGRDVAQGPRARHRRPRLRPARAADVGHRRLTRALVRASAT